MHTTLMTSMSMEGLGQLVPKKMPELISQH